MYQSISLLIILRAQNEVNLQGHAYRIACNVYIKMTIMNTHQFNNDQLLVILYVPQMFQGQKEMKLKPPANAIANFQILFLC